jgi:hypothetical protein
MGDWSDQMRSAAVRRLEAKHAAVSSKLIEAVRAADRLVSRMSRVDRRLYEIEPDAVLSLRTSLAAARAHIAERNS